MVSHWAVSPGGGARLERGPDSFGMALVINWCCVAWRSYFFKKTTQTAPTRVTPKSGEIQMIGKWVNLVITRFARFNPKSTRSPSLHRTRVASNLQSGCSGMFFLQPQPVRPKNVDSYHLPYWESTWISKTELIFGVADAPSFFCGKSGHGSALGCVSKTLPGKSSGCGRSWLCLDSWDKSRERSSWGWLT